MTTKVSYTTQLTLMRRLQVQKVLEQTRHLKAAVSARKLTTTTTSFTPTVQIVRLVHLLMHQKLALTLENHLALGALIKTIGHWFIIIIIIIIIVTIIYIIGSSTIIAIC